MTERQFQQIVRDIKIYILKEAKKNDWLWFYNLHQKEVVKCAEKLLKIYKANREVVIIACWLHDISKFRIKSKLDTAKYHKTHHLDSAKFAKKFLTNYKINNLEREQICNCVLRHRNSNSYKAKTIEEKIVVVADTLSHFTGIFYFTHFKFHPENSVESMVKFQLEKLERDWQDLKLLPKSRNIIKEEYSVIKKLHENYLKN